MKCWITFVFRKAEDWQWNELALSVVLAARHYDVRVVTNLGERVRELGLPCSVVDREFEEARPWSVHKLRTYAAAPDGEPFLHIDSDVFLFGELPDRLFEAPVFAQSLDNQSNYPREESQEWRNTYAPSPHLAFNLGIFGGRPNLVREFAAFALASAAARSTAWATYVEQLTLGRFVQDRRFIPGLLDNGSGRDPSGYTHLMQSSTNPDVQSRVALRLLNECPSVARRLGIRKPMLTILVSRGRVDRLLRTVESWEETRTIAELLVVLDDDDPDWAEAVDALVDKPFVRVRTGKRQGFAQTFDRACLENNEEYEVLGMAANDLVFCTRGWDRRFFDLLKPHHFEGVVYGRDGLHDEQLATHAYFGSVLHRKLGSIVTPDQRHLWVDNNLMAIGRRTRLIYADDVLIRHDHYGVVPKMEDKQYLASNSSANFSHDRQCHVRFERSLAPHFPARSSVVRARVGFVTPCWNIGGSEQWVSQLARGLDPDRFQTEVVMVGQFDTMSRDALGWLPRNVRVVPWEEAPPVDVLLSWSTEQRILDLHQCPTVDVLHIPATIGPNHPMAVRHREKGLRLACVHPALVQNYPASIRPSVKVIPNGSDPRRSVKLGDLSKTVGVGSRKVALMISRLSAEKQPQLFLDAIACLGDEWVGVLAGSGPAHLTPRPNSIILPPAAHPGNLLALADVYVQPSVHESHCLAINEAWLAGVPVVSTDYPVNRWFVDNHGPVMALVPVGCTTRELADKVLEVDQSSWAIALRAKEVALENYTADIMCRRWSEYLWEILK